jgi:hypothetical protein
VRRPGIDHADVLLGNWARFSTFYTNNEAPVGRAPGTAGKDDQGVVGQDSLDAITKARYDQQVAEQNKLTAAAQADAQAAQTAVQIRADQAKVQEQARQDAITAGLNQQALVAHNAVIQQQKANELLAAHQDLAINQAKAAAAAEAAKAANADTAALAAIYQSNPAYANQKAIEAQASAWSKTDKVIVPAGTNPTVVLGDGTQQQQTVVQTPAHSYARPARASAEQLAHFDELLQQREADLRRRQQGEAGGR